ncbi:MAG: 23S rRNA (adenine(2503)-C(2))-methyltransferase [Acidobacteria bacterium RIFCSPLOWO2_02_FULL_59_13]|nr:MAG: 23S rRNA (adenine(2503)-C(2))-methyltransferase [Acidobacteria bacterium RIFCSPLOWO2_02_FULL_59_13]
MEKKELIGLSQSQMEELLRGWEEPAFRGRQLYHALYRERQWDLRKITPFPIRLREKLAEQFQATLPAIEKQFQSVDGTARYLLRLSDGHRIETVWMPEKERNTLCLSTQVGCPAACLFCLTGLMGLIRNLSAGEIVGQVLLLLDHKNSGEKPAESSRTNIVFMGMGEPLLNYENVMEAVKLLADPNGVGISLSRMTLSTSGIVPVMERLAREPVRPRLAVSLNATTDAVRDRLMPLNRKWPLAELLRACREFPLRPRERMTFEYVLLAGVNDSLEDARLLTKLVQEIRCKVNLIGFNPGPELPFRTPPDEHILEFERILRERGVAAFIRKPRGRDIFAACGQLKLMEAQNSASSAGNLTGQSAIGRSAPTA